MEVKSGSSDRFLFLSYQLSEASGEGVHDAKVRGLRRHGELGAEVAVPEPAVERLHARYPGLSDEERFLRYSKAARDMKHGTQVFIQQGDIEVAIESRAA